MSLLGFRTFDKQHILDKSCADAAFKTIKLVSKTCSSLDMNNAFINACTPAINYKSISDISDSIVDCLDLLWKETDHASIDINRVVKTVCRKKYVPDNVIIWVLKLFQHNRIPINEVLMTCSKQRKVNIVTHILHEIDNEQLDINEAFCHVCRDFGHR